jgi:hypothetical protein
MSVITNSRISRPGFVADPASIVRSAGGRQIDWESVSDLFKSGSFNITVDTGGANPGATAIPVTALPGAVKAGQVLNFGEGNFTVTVSASALAAATSISVAALAGPIQSGTVLDFGTNKFARLTADAAAGATSLAVAAIPTALAGAETATVSGQKYAQTTAAAAAGATSLAVEALAIGIDAGDIAIAPSTADSDMGAKKHIKAGTVMCELSSGKVVPRAVRPGAETAIGILETAADQDSATDAISGYGIIKGGMIYENLLPDATGGPPAVLPTAYKTELQTAGVGTGFGWEVYADTRAA